MQSPQLSLSCIPCAKRKVRCDRSKPCSHCRRRRGDICEYPIPIPSSRNSSRSTPSDITQSKRIENLEQYIRNLGHDPNQVSIPNPTNPSESCIPNNLPAANFTLTQNIGVQRAPSSFFPTPRPRGSEQARLVEHNEQTIYIESPLWHSWSEAKQPAPSSERDNCGYSATMMDPGRIEITESLSSTRPSCQETSELWALYLSHVHPLTKLFFDWDKEPLLRKAADAQQTLSKSEEAFSSAIYFITLVCISNEERETVMGDLSKAQLLDNFQSAVETALIAAGLIATSDLLVLQAFLLYFIAMRNRARPASLFSLLGIAIRIAQRMGLHRDGSSLGLTPFQTEERRRIWWQMQHMEIMISQILGTISLTLYANWDTKLPGNFEDNDIRQNMEVLPTEHSGLTSMSHCMWRYYILYYQRVPRQPDTHRDFASLTSPQVSLVAKVAFVDQFAGILNEKFVKHCELLNPLHVSIQIGTRGFILAMRRTVYQPRVAHAKISEIPKSDRETLLKICVECLEYYILAETTPSIAQFRWYNELYFQWTAFVYIIIEAHYRATDSDASSLWTLIDKVYKLHPKLAVPAERLDIVAIGRLVVTAWHQGQERLQNAQQSTSIEKPWCVVKIEDELISSVHGSKETHTEMGWDAENFMALDFDLIDWSVWEQDGYGILV